MSDEQDSTTTEQDSEEQEPTQNDAAADSDESEEDSSETSFNPEVARKQIHKLLKENRATRERAAAAEKKAAGADDATKQAATLSSENLRLRVGLKLKLPVEAAEVLQGETEEQMVEHAEKLMNLFAPARPSATRKPTEALRAGLEPDTEPEETDLKKIGERMFRS